MLKKGEIENLANSFALSSEIMVNVKVFFVFFKEHKCYEVSALVSSL